MVSPSYLLPRSDAAELPAATSEALDRLEHQFDLSTDKLKEILKQFLWEYNKGLSEYATEENKGTFMSVPPPRSVVCLRLRPIDRSAERRAGR